MTNEESVAADQPDLESAAEASAGSATEPGVEPESSVDLDAIADDLADVEIALARLDNGTYWTDEVTGVELPEEFLERFPTARRSPAG